MDVLKIRARAFERGTERALQRRLLGTKARQSFATIEEYIRQAFVAVHIEESGYRLFGGRRRYTDRTRLGGRARTVGEPKDALAASARALRARAGRLGCSVRARTLHGAVFERAETFAAAERMGILLSPAAE